MLKLNLFRPTPAIPTFKVGDTALITVRDWVCYGTSFEATVMIVAVYGDLVTIKMTNPLDEGVTFRGLINGASGFLDVVTGEGTGTPTVPVTWLRKQ